jgi:hypothetical protein
MSRIEYIEKKTTDKLLFQNSKKKVNELLYKFYSFQIEIIC